MLSVVRGGLTGVQRLFQRVRDTLLRRVRHRSAVLLTLPVDRLPRPQAGKPDARQSRIHQNGNITTHCAWLCYTNMIIVSNTT